MSSNMGSVTQLALRAITDEQLLQDKYSTPEEVLDYLQEESNFKSLSTLLKETMIAAGVCTESDPESNFINELYNRLVKQDKDCKKDKKRNKITIERWVTGKEISGTKSKSIRYRNDAIEICFALNLNLDLSRTFLNKCGYNSFNIRNAEDATYLYCIISKRPLSAAKGILSRFLSHTIEEGAVNKVEIGNHSGSTTIILENQLLGHSSWESDDLFLETFLIPNRDKFIGFSLTALNKYYTFKNYLFSTVFINDTKNEKHFIWERFDENSDITKKDVPVSLALRSALRKYNNSVDSLFNLCRENNESLDAARVFAALKKVINDTNSTKLFPSILSDIIDVGMLQPDISLFSSVLRILREYDNEAISRLCTANAELNDMLDNTEAALISIRNSILACDDIKSQKQFSKVFSDSMKTEGLLKHVVDSIISNSGRIRKYTDSKLSESVMKEFPDDKSFANYEKDPRIIDKGMTIRKAVILMYYIAYAYEFSTTLYSDDPNYTSTLFGELGFVEFMDHLNETLSDCRLPALYPANQFDWLILRSIREFEVSDYADDEDNPIAFFNDVLAYSFVDAPANEDQ